MKTLFEYFNHSFLQNYEIWKDFQKTYDVISKDIDLTNFLQLPCFHYKQVDEINQCKSTTVVIDNITESVHSEKYFRKYNDNKHYIIFSGGEWDTEKTNIGITSYDNLCYWFWLIEMVYSYMNINSFCYYFDKFYDFSSPKPNIFCSLIGNERSVRDKLVKNILEKIKYKNYILRYSAKNLGVPADHLDLEFNNEFDPHVQISPNYYYSAVQYIPIQIYNCCYLNLVVEADIDRKNCFFITEKTIKALISGIPFVIVSTPGFLKKIQEAGFRTYGELWDENYDMIEDTDLRLAKIVNLLEDLNTFDWDKNKNELQSIAVHNLRILLTMNTMYNTFFNNLETVIDRYNKKINFKKLLN